MRCKINSIAYGPLILPPLRGFKGPFVGIDGNHDV